MSEKSWLRQKWEDLLKKDEVITITYEEYDQLIYDSNCWKRLCEMNPMCDQEWDDEADEIEVMF